MEVGNKIRVDSRHWLRANALGVLCEFDGKRGDNHWKCEFEPEIGRGFDGGKFLWLADNQMTQEKGKPKNG